MEERATLPHAADDVDLFKPLFKKFKRRDQSLDLSDVVDLNTFTPSLGSDSPIVQVKPIVPSVTPVAGLKPVQDWRIFHFLRHKGFYLIVNPFVPGCQRYWVSRCLQDLPLPPNITNLPVHPHLDPSTVWSSFVDDFNNRQCQIVSSSSPLRKLRWTTIGYHYHWDTKEYQEEDVSPFPQDIAVLSKFVARVLDFSQFRAEAGIINYYHHDSTLGAHTDHSELDHDAPLLSFSFGQDAVFLMGGLTKAQSPTAVMLHSGDICVMSGDARLAYHAVPRILPSPTLTPPLCFHMTQQDRQMVQASVAMGTRMDVDSDDELGTGVTGVANPTGSSESSSVKSTSNIPVRKTTSGTCTAAHFPKSSLTGGGTLHVSASDDDGQSPSKGSETHTADADTCTRKRRSPSEDSEPHTAASRHKMKSVSEESEIEMNSIDNSSNLSVCRQSASQESEEHTDTSDSCICKNESEENEGEPVTTDCCSHKSTSEESEGHTPSCGSCSHKSTSEKSEEHTETSDSCKHNSASMESEGETKVYEKLVRQVNRGIVDRLENLEWAPFAAYLSTSRLNANIRQVLKPGHTFNTSH